MLARTLQNPKGFARNTALWSGILAVVAIYLATRPEPLIDSRTSESSVPIERVFRILAAENATMRALWTAEIVGAGTKARLKFDNGHLNSPKTDWKLNDILGATTWSYPKDKVTIEEVLQIIAALRSGFAAAYDGYLTKAATFEKPPEVGERWPRDGYYLPTLEAFMREFERRASANTVDRLLQAFE